MRMCVAVHLTKLYHYSKPIITKRPERVKRMQPHAFPHSRRRDIIGCSRHAFDPIGEHKITQENRKVGVRVQEVFKEECKGSLFDAKHYELIEE